MTSVKRVELSVRAAMLMKETASLVGTTGVPLARLIIVEIKEQVRGIEKFLNTTEVEK